MQGEARTRFGRSAQFPLLGALACVAVLWSCRHDESPSLVMPVRSGALPKVQLIAPATEVFSVDAFLTEREVMSIDVARDAPHWRLSNGVTLLEAGGDGAVIGIENGRPAFSLEIEHELGAGSIDVLEFGVSDMPVDGKIKVSWAGPSSGFGVNRSMALTQRDAFGGRHRVFRFLVGAQVGWSGVVDRIRLGFSGHFGPAVRVTSIRAMELTMNPNASAAVSEPRFIELGGDWRTAVASMPGIPQHYRAEVEPGNFLEFEYGVTGTAKLSTTFRVLANGPDDAEPRVVFTDVVGADETRRRGRWLVGEAKLDVDRPGEVVLTFETLVEGEVDPVRGLPSWAGPRIVSNAETHQLPDIVLISIDTLRADHLPMYGYRRNTTPRLHDWLSRRGIMFETVVAQAPWTLPSHASMLTGLDCLSHAVNHPTPASGSLVTVAEKLRSRGYTTGAVTGGSYLHPRYGLAQGFDTYAVVKGALADEIDRELAWARKWLGSISGNRPVFLFVHTYAVHDPYRPSEPFHTRVTGESADPTLDRVFVQSLPMRADDGFLNRNGFVRVTNDGAEEPVSADGIEEVRDLYDCGIAYLDDRLGGWLEELDPRTVVIITSDHGEALGEHSLAGHTSLFDHDLLVPLFMRLPEGSPGGLRIPHQVRLIDLAPTITEIAGVEDGEPVDGSSLVPLLLGVERSGRPGLSYAALSNRGLSLRSDDWGGWKYIFQNVPWPGDEVAEALYDLGEDPAEEQPLPATAGPGKAMVSAVHEALMNRAKGFWIQLKATDDSAARVWLQVGGGCQLARTTVKSPDHRQRWTFGSRARISASIPGGGATRLWIENLHKTGCTLAVVGRVEGTAGGSWQDLPSVEMPLEPFDGVRRLQLRLGDGDALVQITTWWSEKPEIGTEDPLEVDPDLEQQLKALGYI